MKKRFLLFYLFCGLGFALLILFFLKDHIRRRILEERQSDVALLTRLCLQSTNSIYSIDELFAKLKDKHIILHAPIPLDPRKPCYFLANPYIVGTNSTINVLSPTALLIVETNINDQRYKFASSLDGSVFLLPPNKKTN